MERVAALRQLLDALDGTRLPRRDQVALERSVLADDVVPRELVEVGERQRVALADVHDRRRVVHSYGERVLLGRGPGRCRGERDERQRECEDQPPAAAHRCAGDVRRVPCQGIPAPTGMSGAYPYALGLQTAGENLDVYPSGEIGPAALRWSHLWSTWTRLSCASRRRTWPSGGSYGGGG